MRINVAAGIVGVVFLSLLLIAGFGREKLAEELASITRSKESANIIEGDRSLLLMHKAAFKIWRDYPWFGVGGWGFRNLLGLYTPTDQWCRLTEGKANIHNDPLQFAVEFGAVGGLLMAGVFILLVKPALACLQGCSDPLARYNMLGCGLLFVYSFMDLPFRSPAILYAWIVMLSSAPALASRPNDILEQTRKEEKP